MQGERLLGSLQVSLIAPFITLPNVNCWFNIFDVDVSIGEMHVWEYRLCFHFTQSVAAPVFRNKI